MSAGGGPLSERFRRAPGKLGVYAPWPLVGVTVLLVALVIFTPVLVTNSHQPGPGILTQAELVVDRTAGNSTFHFYVWALGETIRYDQIDIGMASSFNWTGTTNLNWTAMNWTEWNNDTGVLSVILNSQANPVALNISAHYVSPSGSTWYFGLLAFYVSPATASSGESLYSASGTSGISVTSPLGVSNTTLPAVILLKDIGPGGPP